MDARINRVIAHNIAHRIAENTSALQVLRIDERKGVVFKALEQHAQCELRVYYAVVVDADMYSDFSIDIEEKGKSTHFQIKKRAVAILNAEGWGDLRTPQKPKVLEVLVEHLLRVSNATHLYEESLSGRLVITATWGRELLRDITASLDEWIQTE